MSDLLYIVGMIASIAAIMWCMYHIGWGDGYERGLTEGIVTGFTSSPEIYDGLDLDEDTEEDE